MKPFYCCLAIFLVAFSSVCSAQWTQGKAYPGGFTDAVVEFTIGDTVYIGGGSAGSTAFYKFDPSANTWTRKKDIPQRAFGVSFSIGSKGYMALGQSDPQGTGQASVTNDLWEYDPTTDHWTQKQNFPGAARDAAFAFVIGNKAYVGGGTDTGYRVYSDFYSYDQAVGQWSPLGALPDYLYFNSTFVIGNYGYLATGVNANNELTSLWQYDPSHDAWNPMSDFPGAARESAVSFTLGNLGYVGLGQSQYTSVFTDFYSYDPSSDTWKPVTAFPATHGRGWAAAVATPTAAFVGLGTYFAGGGLVANDDFWKFDLSASVEDPSPISTAEVFPNPASDFIHITTPSALGGRMVLRNALGVACISSTVPSDGRVDISSLPSGVYEMEIASASGHSATRIVKK